MMIPLRNVTLRAIPQLIRAIPSINFSSFAEDKIVFQLLPADTGFYVDVGAFHPIVGSNTYKLYLRGWRGVTIEPNPDNARLFPRVRPGDRHLVMGIALEAGEYPYHRSEHAAMNHFGSAVSMETIHCAPLDSVLDPQRHIDFLSIDCEGMDFDVVQSLDWTRQRPTVICIEDYEQRDLGSAVGASLIRGFMYAQDYWLIGQSLDSFIYVDDRAFFKPAPQSGFRINESMAELVRRKGAL
jgi:FkbM family methyltransferase